MTSLIGRKVRVLDTSVFLDWGGEEPVKVGDIRTIDREDGDHKSVATGLGLWGLLSTYEDGNPQCYPEGDPPIYELVEE